MCSEPVFEGQAPRVSTRGGSVNGRRLKVTGEQVSICGLDRFFFRCVSRATASWTFDRLSAVSRRLERVDASSVRNVTAFCCVDVVVMWAEPDRAPN